MLANVSMLAKNGYGKKCLGTHSTSKACDMWWQHEAKLLPDDFWSSSLRRRSMKVKSLCWFIQLSRRHARWAFVSSLEDCGQFNAAWMQCLCSACYNRIFSQKPFTTCDEKIKIEVSSSVGELHMFTFILLSSERLTRFSSYESY